MGVRGKECYSSGWFTFEEGPVINVEDSMQLSGKSSLGRGSSKCSAKLLERTVAGCFCVQVTRTVGLEQNEQGKIGRK